ncbi:MAG: hypothetical protein OXG11_09020 [Chloroflexi bacterium]|nr:hypothetical protein [Chloroflexota bacterium]
MTFWSALAGVGVGIGTTVGTGVAANVGEAGVADRDLAVGVGGARVGSGRGVGGRRVIRGRGVGIFQWNTLKRKFS